MHLKLYIFSNAYLSYMPQVLTFSISIIIQFKYSSNFYCYFLIRTLFRNVFLNFQSYEMFLVIFHCTFLA